MNTDIDYLLKNLIDNLDNTITNIKKIIDIKDKNLQIEELKMISNISTNTHRLSDETQEILLLILDQSNNEQTAEEISKIREMKINNKVQKILLPYMVYLKFVLENNS